MAWEVAANLWRNKSWLWGKALLLVTIKNSKTSLTLMSWTPLSRTLRLKTRWTLLLMISQLFKIRSTTLTAFMQGQWAIVVSLKLKSPRTFPTRQLMVRRGQFKESSNRRAHLLSLMNNPRRTSAEQDQWKRAPKQRGTTQRPRHPD